MRKIIISVVLFFFFYSSSQAEEGMWIPILLQKYNLAQMQQMGFELSAQDIYDINNASMKDAVVVFGGGCTGEMISDEGLLITNHHCGYRQIQSHSSVENDYLTHGFWAMNRDEELPNPGLSVRFLNYMEDVTHAVLEGINGLNPAEKEKKIKENTAAIELKASERGRYFTQVKPLFYGNQYFLYVYKIYSDVRLVGTPPSAIGKFGGDTDNWMWPRHTGDFSLFRVYAGKDNEPAEYSPDNVPYKPKKFFPISLEGVKPGDFTMIFGNPGTTMQYIPSHEVEIIMNQRNPCRVAIRDRKLEIIGRDMKANPLVRIQYAAKYATISNAWKKWQGEVLGLQRLEAVERKREFESEFRNWAVANGTWDNKYSPVFTSFDSIYAVYQDIIKASDYYSEIVFRGVELFELASRFNSIIHSIENGQTNITGAQILSVEKLLPAFFKDFNQPTDEKLFEELIPLLNNDLNPAYLPDYLPVLMTRYKNADIIDKIYRKSALTDRHRLESLLAEKNYRELLKLRKDPIIKLYNRLNFHHEMNIKPVLDRLNSLINQNMSIYMAGIMQMKKNEPLYPDANLTLRVAYGKVEGYEPEDGVKYLHYTTLEGIMEKHTPEIYDYDVPPKLQELYNEKDYGIYKIEEGHLPVCFLASNHTTGGNSGSPVVNARGHLVGINFDRVWESTMSDIIYDPEMSRNISIDIRYALFIIDKFAGAGYLLGEMELIGVETEVMENFQE